MIGICLALLRDHAVWTLNLQPCVLTQRCREIFATGDVQAGRVRWFGRPWMILPISQVQRSDTPPVSF